MDIINNVSARYLMDQYVSHDLPVVVKDGMVDWPATNLENIIQVFFKIVICGIDSFLCETLESRLTDKMIPDGEYANG